MFEVGKKYQDRGMYGRKIVEVLAATEKYAIVKYVEWCSAPEIVGREVAWGQDVFHNWKEYKEPRTTTRWVNVYNKNGELVMGATYSTKEEAIRFSSSHTLDIIPITYTEPR